MISIHALREERDHRCGKRHHKNQISIHALREERDFMSIDIPKQRIISIHALREERDMSIFTTGWQGFDFNPRAPRGARHVHIYNWVAGI